MFEVVFGEGGEPLGHVYRIGLLFWVWEVYTSSHSRPGLQICGNSWTRGGAARTVRNIAKRGM